jgi:hypothetical protein
VSESTGEFRRPEPGGPSDTSQFTRPSWATASGPADDGPRGHDESESSETGEYAAPGYTGASSGGQGALAPGSELDLPQGGRQQEYDPDFGIPAVPTPSADAPTPIFESIESNWFRASSGSAPARHEPVENGSGAERTSPSVPRPGQPASAVPPMPQRHAARASAEGANSTAGAVSSNGSDPTAHWGASPNDERWRRAEQVKQPAAGGVTTSGLPRRVPRANLVAGTAQQQSSAQAGPQVSRAPDDVRGRLTNLRRGIQQGRQAGSANGRGIGPHYQQER